MGKALCFLLVACASYLLGCVNGAILTSRLFYHDDIRKHGSGNAGLTNFYRTYGAKLALLVIGCDMAKAALAVALGAWAFPTIGLSSVLGKYFAAFFCVVGHMFPALYGFKGGKGILCSGTLLLCLNWRVALVGWGLFLVLWLTTRYVSLGSVSAAIGLPISTHFVYAGQGWVLLFASLISLLVLWAHRENIVRLLNGTEHKFKFHVNAPKKED
ncbi:MAG: glycerol-3-phosphate 1-O-acyltransferase PlsY, partial [Oscillospiraceae bacterium]|nr:glycerol-3-phosphate 1-O-acyltransferase PlsY [Oscillospiraceae bacterium]